MSVSPADLLNPSEEPTAKQIAHVTAGFAADVQTKKDGIRLRDGLRRVPDRPTATPVLVMVCGPNGSGKTTLTERMLKDGWLGDAVYINPDNVAQAKYGDWNSPDAVIRAATYSSAERERCLAERRSLAVETVFSAPDKIDYIARAKAAGFFVRLFFIATDGPEINVSRVAMRVAAGGHAVPADKIRSRYPKSIANCLTAAGIADRVYVFDNSIDDAPPRLLFRTGAGLSNRADWVNPWAQEIAGGVFGSSEGFADALTAP